MENYLQIRRVMTFEFFVLFVSLMLLAGIACTPSQAELLEGILHEVDAINGEITIVTKEGKTVTLTIATENTEGLELGESVKVEVEDGAVVRLEETGTQSAEDFAADCNDDGMVSVNPTPEDYVKVTGGSGTIARDCTVTIAEGKKLKIVTATLESTGSAFFIVGENMTGLKVQNSTINMGSGELRFTSGDDSEVKVERSTLTGDPIDLGAAQRSPGNKCELEVYEGRARVRESILTAVGEIRITTGENCKTEVSNSTLSTGGDIELAAADDGETEVSESTLTAGGDIHISAGEDGQTRYLTTSSMQMER